MPGRTQSGAPNLTTRETPSQAPSRGEIHDELDRLFRLDDEAAGELLLVRHARPAGNRDIDSAPVTDTMLSVRACGRPNA